MSVGARSRVSKLHNNKKEQAQPFGSPKARSERSQKKHKAPNLIRSGRALFKVLAWDWLPAFPFQEPFTRDKRHLLRLVAPISRFRALHITSFKR